MPIIYMLNKQKCLEKEPYAAFDKKYKMLYNELHESTIELPITFSKRGQFVNGFYSGDYSYQPDTLIKFNYAKVNPEQVGVNGEECTFIRCTYSFEYNETDMLDYHLSRLKAFSLRTDYYFIPNALYLEFSYKVDKEISIFIDAIVLDKKDVQQVCHSMINQLVAIFSLDD